MVAKTNYAEALVLNWLLTATSVTRPTATYCALHTADPTETGAVAQLTAGNGYSRQPVTFNNAAQPFANSNLVSFGPCVTADWGTITHFSIWDAASGGNCLYYAALSASRNIAVSDKLEFAIGDLSVDET